MGRSVGGADGELVTVEEGGDPEGLPVFVHPGSPGSRRLARRTSEAAAGHGLRLLSFDRPGYAARPPRPGRTVADGAAETALVADGLGIGRFAVWGFSGGGPYALACAALLPERVVAVAVFASFAPYGPAGPDFCGDWPPPARAEVDRFFADRPAARENWRRDAEAMRAGLTRPQAWWERWGAAAGTDEAHDREAAEHLAAVFADALSAGDEGYWDDWAALLTPWGADLSAVRAPVRLWHGLRDRNVPVANGRWLAAHVPGATPHFPDADHTGVEDDHRTTACAWLAALTRQGPTP
jgi:pimeloyl-ACP methyl ester carboxylesterase